MKWSARLGRFAGIDVYVHVTFLLLLAWVAWSYWAATGTLAGVGAELALVLLLFLCVLLHEYGHALTARRFGIGTRSITLLPIGGLALLEAIPKDPRQEILVALAGPAVNLAIAAFLWLVIALTGQAGAELHLLSGRLLPTLLAANLVLAVFNLLPIPPLDGFGVLESLLPARLQPIASLMRRFGLLLLVVVIFSGVLRSLLGPVVRAVNAVLLG